MRWESFPVALVFARFRTVDPREQTARYLFTIAVADLAAKIEAPLQVSASDRQPTALRA